MLKAQVGVLNASVNYANSSVCVEYAPEEASISDFKAAVQSIGYDLLIEDGGHNQQEEMQHIHYKKLKTNTLWATILSLPVVVIAMFLMNIPYANWIMLILTTPVIAWFGRSFFVNAFNQSKHGKANMDTLVALSTGIAYLFSLFSTFFPEFWHNRGQHAHVYFEASAVVIAFILLGKVLEERAKSNTSSAIKKLIGLQPNTVNLIRENGQENEMPISQVVNGDKLLVKPSDKIPVDGEIISGTSFIDESTITGESLPAEKEKGGKVFAGTINQKGSFVFLAQKVGGETILSQIIKMVQQAQGSKPPVQNQVAYIPGRIEKLMVNFTGEMVRKGQPLALIYSPELVTAQQELLETSKTKQAQPDIYEAAKEKLQQWKLTDKQISEIENSGKVQANMEVESTASGIVTARRVNNGDYVSQGSVLYEVSDLSRVWVLFDAYESDLPFLKKGDKVDFSIQALPGSAYSRTIMFIDPVIDPVNRVAKIRLEMSNPGAKLKPEIFATGIVKSNLAEYKDKLVIPRSAVLWTGKRSIVYVKQTGDEPVFKIGEIELGPMLGNSYVVTEGLKDGEEIVTVGAFSVDAAAQLEGKPSMMNQEGGKKATSMPGMVMPSDPKQSTPVNTKPANSNDMSGMEMQNSSETHPMTSSHRMSEQIKVSGNCEQCKTRIETAAKSVSGVSSAEWSSETKMLHVQFDGAKTNSDAIQKAIAKVGHDTENFKASESVYKELPECCLYRK